MPSTKQADISEQLLLLELPEITEQKVREIVRDASPAQIQLILKRIDEEEELSSFGADESEMMASPAEGDEGDSFDSLRLMFARFQKIRPLLQKIAQSPTNP